MEVNERDCVAVSNSEVVTGTVTGKGTSFVEISMTDSLLINVVGMDAEAVRVTGKGISFVEISTGSDDVPTVTGIGTNFVVISTNDSVTVGIACVVVKIAEFTIV